MPKTIDHETEWIAFAVSLGVRLRNARRLVRFYIEQAQTDWDFQSWVLTYADPTGEAATTNIMRRQASA